MSNFDLPAVARRVARTFAQAFLAIYPASNVIAWLSGVEAFDASLARAAAVSGGVALVSLFWNAVIDPSPIPSLTGPDDKQPA